MVKKLGVALGVCVLVAGAVSPAMAATTPAQKCAAAKQKAAGKKASSKMGCYSKAKAKSLTVDPACLTKAEAKFSSAMAKAGAACPGTAPTIESLVDSCVSTLVADVPGDGKCPSASAKAAGKATGAELACTAKEITKPGSLAACHAKADGKLSAAISKAGACGQSGTLQADVHNCRDSISGALPPTTTTSTTSSTSSSTSTSSTSTSTSSSTSTSLPSCCSAERTTLTSSAGTLTVGPFAPFPFPAGVITKIDSGAPDLTCKHNVIVPSGGFAVPSFCIPALQYTSQVQTTGCESGGADGKGVLWDGNAGIFGGVPQTHISKVADSSDGTCDPGSGVCANDDNNFLGQIVTTRTTQGDPNKVAVRLDIPAHSRTWQDSLGCPGDGVYNPSDGDTLVTEFDFILSPTTGSAVGAFVDLNGNGCDLPGGSSGFGSPAKGPVSLTGSQANGPCCTIGDTSTVVTVGEAFSNSFPLYDLGFRNSVPSSVTSCGAASGGSCVITTDACQGSPSGAFLQ